MTNFDNILSSLARGGPGGVRYDGDSLTNEGEFRERIELAELLEQMSSDIAFPADVGSGAAIAAAEDAISGLQGDLLKMADGLREIGEVGLQTAPIIRSGTAADPEVQDALRRLSAAAKAVADSMPEVETPSDPSEDRIGVGSQFGPRRGDSDSDDDTVVGSPVTTAVSSDQTAPPPSSTATMPPPVGQTPLPQAQGAAAGIQSSPVLPTAVTGRTPGPITTTNAKPKARDADSPDSPIQQPGPVHFEGAVAAVPVPNPSVTGGRVDPGQITGRTASTSPSAGLPPLKTGPAGATGQLGGMGGLPLGGAPMAGGGGGSGRPDMPQLRRDRASERILTGEEARDKALISHILRDDDPPVDGYIGGDELFDALPDERHPSSPPIQYPGEPRDDEKW